MGVLVSWRTFAISLVVVAAVAICAITVNKILFRPPETVSEVLHKMHEYQQEGRYSDAIALGDKWIRDFPQDGSNDQVFGQIAFLYLNLARSDSRNKEADVQKALEFRDKMLPVLSDAKLGWYSAAALEDAISISEFAGDISEGQRCVQYRNSLKLLERQKDLLKQKQTELSNKTEDQFGYKSRDLPRLLKRADDSITRITGKQVAAQCH